MNFTFGAAFVNSPTIYIFVQAIKLSYPNLENEIQAVGRLGKSTLKKEKKSSESGYQNALQNDSSRFLGYARQAISKLNLGEISDEVLLQVWDSVKPQMVKFFAAFYFTFFLVNLIYFCSFFQRYIGPFWSLRAVIGPVIESLILLDRAEFLKENISQLHRVDLLPLFQPEISPRNMVLVAVKDGHSIS